MSNISFLNIDLKRKEINFNSNQITVRDKLVFPSGYFVNFHPGTEIILSDEGQLISYSPIKMIGTQSNPIIIKSNFNGSLKKYRNLKKFKNEYNFGNGLLVMNAKGESIIKHTIFKNIGAPEIESGVGLMGAINFYRSNVIIENSKFIENLRGDDFLNIISSNFSLKNITMENIFLDAIDFDFSNGRIDNIIIENAGNDGLDFSGSNVVAKNILIKNSGDKGLSVGEQSVVDIQDLKLINTNIGIASKDLSKISIRDVSISDSKLAIAAYQKKPEYGPGFVTITNINLKNCLNSYISEEKSEINVDGKKISSSKKIFNLLLKEFSL